MSNALNREPSSSWWRAKKEEKSNSKWSEHICWFVVAELRETSENWRIAAANEVKLEFYLVSCCLLLAQVSLVVFSCVQKSQVLKFNNHCYLLLLAFCYFNLIYWIHTDSSLFGWWSKGKG